MNFEKYQELVKSIEFGKDLPEAVYLHKSALTHLPRKLNIFIENIASALKICEGEWDLVKLFKRDFKLSFLSYPDFFEFPYPPLRMSHSVDLNKKSHRSASYIDSVNPPILHRRELFLHPAHPLAEELSAYTHEGEVLGLYENTKVIGTKQGWIRTIKRSGHMLDESGHLRPLQLIESCEEENDSDENIHRHKTAISRDKLSIPMFTLAKAGFLNGDYSVLDYGCGKGDDLRELEAHGIDCVGWDPVYRPDVDPEICDVVNLGYVINVIEDINERRETLSRAFSYTEKILAVSAMLGNESIADKFRPYKDGVLTKAKTFQKYYYQSELKEFIERSLEVDAIAAGPGLFFIFKDKINEQRYLSERQRTRINWRQISSRTEKLRPPKVTKTKIEKNESILKDFWCCCLDLGRPAGNDEFEHSDQLRQLFGSHSSALSICQHHFNGNDLQEAEKIRRNDLLVYLALDHFGKRDVYSRMPESLRRDIKHHFHKYQTARNEARELLFSVSDPQLILESCQLAATALPASLLTEEHNLVFEKDFLNLCPAPLRVYVGCALQLYGDLDSIDLIKVHIQSGKVTLMAYENYESDPIPRLKERIKIKMREQDIDFYDYVYGYRPQPLLIKSRFMSKDCQRYAAQAKFDQRLLDLIGDELLEEHISAERLDVVLESNGIKLDEYSIIST